MTPRLRWTSKSLVKLSGELNGQGHGTSPTALRRLMYQGGWRLQSNNKSLAKSPPHPDRDAQFGYINKQVAAFAARAARGQRGRQEEGTGRELRQRRPGTGPRRGGDRRSWTTTSPAGPRGRPSPTASTTWGRTRASSASATITTPRRSPPPPWSPGGSPSAASATRTRRSSWSPPTPAAPTPPGPAPTRSTWPPSPDGISWSDPSHYPSGTSKWNKVEHRLFSFISVNWRGKPLASYETVLELIGATTTRTGLTVTASRDAGTCPTGEKISDKDMRHLEKTRITRHDWHPDWNYPSTQQTSQKTRLF